MNEIHNLKACIRKAKSALNCEEKELAESELTKSIEHASHLTALLNWARNHTSRGSTDEAFKLLEGIDV